MRQISKNLNAVSAMAIALLLAAALLAVPVAKGSAKNANQGRVVAPIDVAILIQDDLIPRVANELDEIREFIRSLPKGSNVMVGYITAGTLQVRQPFTGDLEKAAGRLRITISRTSASAFNPYVEVVEGLRKFDPNPKNQNVALLISDGLDTSRGFDSGSVLQSIDLERAIREAKERNVAIYAFYAPSTGLTSQSRLASSWGQSSLNRLAEETGGKAFFQGTSFVSFNSHFERLIRELNRPYSVEP
jgi:hypothetical protein